MSYAGLTEAFLTSQICEGAWDYGPNVQTDEELLREKHPSLKEAYNEYIQAKQKYDMLYKLVKVTDKF